MTLLKLGYFLVAFVLAVTGIVNTVTTTRHKSFLERIGQRLEAVERVRDRIRDRRIHAGVTGGGPTGEVFVQEAPEPTGWLFPYRFRAEYQLEGGPLDGKSYFEDVFLNTPVAEWRLSEHLRDSLPPGIGHSGTYFFVNAESLHEGYVVALMRYVGPPADSTVPEVDPPPP